MTIEQEKKQVVPISNGPNAASMQVVPLEHQHGKEPCLQITIGKEEKQVVPVSSDPDAANMQVVPLEHQHVEEPGLQITMGKEEKQVAGSLRSTSRLQVDNRGGVEDHNKMKRSRLQRIIVLLFMVTIIIIIVVTMTIVAKLHKGSSNSTR